ncbi:hypothetical protein TNCV_3810141 [Trichonephila clavipes]|nr:hypothetical protein TNCV_3810141 [Trichonephila clavipes]
MLPNSTGKFRTMIVGSLWTTNHNRTWGCKPHPVGLIRKTGYERCDVECSTSEMQRQIIVSGIVQSCGHVGHTSRSPTSEGLSDALFRTKSVVLAISTEATRIPVGGSTVVATDVYTLVNSSGPRIRNIRA